jgi:hypothetical protein
MPHKKGYFSVRTWQDLVQAIGAGVLLAISLCACNFAANFPTTNPPTATKQPDTTQPDMTVWKKKESPPFPSTWPPTPDTVWVRYTFAYGSNPPKLMDGVYVTAPLSKTEWKRGTPTTTELSSDMTQAAVQGVIQLDTQTIHILENEKQVSAYCLTITELPTRSTSKTKEMLAYYQAWFKYNGAFLGLIQKNHADFIDWVGTNK